MSPSGQPFDGLTGAESNLGSAYTLGWETKEKWAIEAGITEGDIVGCYTPQALPVLSALAKGQAVCDRRFSSVPTETRPNRAFAGAATSQGHAGTSQGHMVLAGVTVPVAAGPGPAAGTVSHLESIRAELISRRYPAGVTPPPPAGTAIGLTRS